MTDLPLLISTLEEDDHMLVGSSPEGETAFPVDGPTNCVTSSPPVQAGRRAITLAAEDRDRPSKLGALLGEALAAMAQAGDAQFLSAMCATCAFRPGCMTNQLGGTGLLALNCTLGIDPDDFACHHGMADGNPTRLCAGYYAAKSVPFEALKAIMARLAEQMADLGDADEVRERFDAWIATVDPHNQMDDYERGRAYLRTFGTSPEDVTQHGSTCRGSADTPSGVPATAPKTSQVFHSLHQGETHDA